MSPKKTSQSSLHLIPTDSPAPLVLPSLSQTTHSSKRLEDRVAHLEKDLHKSIHHLEEHLHRTLRRAGLQKQEKALQKELQRITHLLDEKIQAIQTPLNAKKELHPPKADPIKVLQHYVRRLFSLKTYRRLLLGVANYHFEEFDEFGRDPAFERQVKPFFDFLYSKYWRVDPHGLENIPSQGSALIVGNHSGTLPFDGSMVRMSVTNGHPSKRDVRFLVEDFVYYLPFVGDFMYKIGGVRASPENAERLLRKGHLVTVFPEGEKGIGKSYKLRYHLQRFGRGGFIKIALKTGAPIIPCAIIGAEETHPLLYKTSLLAKPFGIPYVPITPTMPWLGPLGLLGLPAKWKIYYGKPIDLSSYGKKAIDDDLLVHRLSEMVRQNIQEMILEGLKKRRSIWWG